MVHRVFNSAQYLLVNVHHVVNGGQYVSQMAKSLDYTALESILTLKVWVTLILLFSINFKTFGIIRFSRNTGPKTRF